MAVSLIDVLDDQKIGKNLLEVAKHTQVVSVAVNIRKRQWRLRLNLHRQISNEEINSLKSALATITPGPVLLEVDFQFVSTQSMGEEINFEYLKEELIKKFPVARCWLQNTQWECNGKKLEITLPDEASLELLRVICMSSPACFIKVYRTFEENFRVNH